jgi:hypothetical protein
MTTELAPVRNSIEQTELEELAQEEATLAKAQQAIREILAKRAARQKAADIATLAKVRAELLERQTFYDEHLPIFRAQEQDYSNARAHIIVAREALAESSRGHPAVAVFLPEDPVVRRWSKCHAQLEQRLADAEAALRALPDPETIRLSLVYCGEVISRLTYSQTNLVRKLSGETATWMDGGVSNVGGSALPGSGKAWIR